MPGGYENAVQKADYVVTGHAALAPAADVLYGVDVSLL